MKKRADSHARRRRKARRKRIPDQAFSQPRNADSLFRRVLDHLKQHCVPCEPDETSGRIGVEVHYFPEENTTLRDPDGNAIVQVMLTIDEQAKAVGVQAYVPWGIRTASEWEMVQGFLENVFSPCGLDLTFQDNPSGFVGIRATTCEPDSVCRRLREILLLAHVFHPIVRHVMQNNFQAAAEAYKASGLGDDMPDKEWVSRRREELAGRLQEINLTRVHALSGLIKDKTRKHAEAVKLVARNAGVIDLSFYVPSAFGVLVDRTIVGHDLTISALRTTELVESLDNILATSCRNHIVRVSAKPFFSNDHAESGDG